MTEKQCEKCGIGFEIKEGEEFKTMCRKCYAISKGGKPYQKPKQVDVSSFKPADKVSPTPEDNKWMNPVYADCFTFVADLINNQGDTGKVFDGNAFASMVNTLFTRRLGR